MWKQVSTILKERKKLQNLISYQKSTGKNLGGDLNGTHMWEHSSLPGSRIRSENQWTSHPFFALILWSLVTEFGDESFTEERLSSHIHTQNSNIPFLYVTNTKNNIVFNAFRSIPL